MKFIKKLLPFFVLLFIVLGCTKLGRQAPGKLEEQKKVLQILNEKFDLRHKTTLDQKIKGSGYDCQFSFEERAQDGILHSI